jgi:hypothetical protein
VTESSTESARIAPQDPESGEAPPAFLSYATADLAETAALAASLEAAGVACWYADRDIPKGASWPESITDALSRAPVFVLLLSPASNESREVHREVALANSEDVDVLCVRIADVRPAPALKFLLAIANWMDAMAPSPRAHHARIAEAVRRLEREGAERRRARRRPAADEPDHRSAPANALRRIAADVGRFQDLALKLAATMAESPSVLLGSERANQTLVEAAEAYNREVPALVRRLDDHGAMVLRYWGQDAARRFEEVRQGIERDVYRGSVFGLNDERARLNALRTKGSISAEEDRDLAGAIAPKVATVRAQVLSITRAWAALQGELGQGL